MIVGTWVTITDEQWKSETTAKAHCGGDTYERTGEKWVNSHAEAKILDDIRYSDNSPIASMGITLNNIPCFACVNKMQANKRDIRVNIKINPERESVQQRLREYFAYVHNVKPLEFDFQYRALVKGYVQEILVWE